MSNMTMPQRIVAASPMALPHRGAMQSRDPAREDAGQAMLFGGATLDGRRHLWWNFVSSSKERIEQAKQDWRAGRFGTIQGDAEEFIPLPET